VFCVAILIRVSFFQFGRIGFGSRRKYNFGGFQMNFVVEKGRNLRFWQILDEAN
jgi:hypothetical protein